MKVLYCVSEAVPFAKTGGLADVAGALPAALRSLGHDVRVVLPRYRAVSAAGASPVLPVRLPIHGMLIEGMVLETTSPAGVPAYLVDCPRFFDRGGLYTEDGQDYPDNLARFAYLSQAALAVADHVFPADLLHANDWHLALLPLYLDQRARAGMTTWPTLLTVHNLAMQGVFPADQMVFTALDLAYFRPDALEFYGQINCLKGGLRSADLLSTVSVTYAKEIQTPEFGAGLDGELRARHNHLFGILNGVDYTQWDPRVDRHLPVNYGPDDLDRKRLCKRALQEEGGLEPLPYAPLLGVVTRLTDQKGCDLIAAVTQSLLHRGAQLVVLGTGDPRYHDLFSRLAAAYPRQVAVKIGFDEGLAHRIEAGADMFLMPSRFEPSGLNQLYSMRYGTVPIVRRTGGLADSVTDATPEALAGDRATGFVFGPYAAEALWDAIERALTIFGDGPAWQQIMRAGMRADFSWDRSARQYVMLYEEARARRSREAALSGRRPGT